MQKRKKIHIKSTKKTIRKLTRKSTKKTIRKLTRKLKTKKNKKKQKGGIKCLTIKKSPVEPPVADPPVADPPVEPPVEPSVEPPVADPPVADPPVEPPVEPPVADPPVADPPVEPPVEPPVADPPVADPPVDPPVYPPVKVEESEHKLFEQFLKEEITVGDGKKNKYTYISNCIIWERIVKEHRLKPNKIFIKLDNEHNFSVTALYYYDGTNTSYNVDIHNMMNYAYNYYMGRKKKITTIYQEISNMKEKVLNLFKGTNKVWIRSGSFDGSIVTQDGGMGLYISSFNSYSIDNSGGNKLLCYFMNYLRHHKHDIKGIQLKASKLRTSNTSQRKAYEKQGFYESSGNIETYDYNMKLDFVKFNKNCKDIYDYNDIPYYELIIDKPKPSYLPSYVPWQKGHNLFPAPS